MYIFGYLVKNALKEKEKLIAKMQEEQTYATPSISNTSRYH
jgi:hypothetical protein